MQNQIRVGGYMFFTCLTNTLPLPENHGTTNVTLVPTSEIDKIMSGWNIVYREEGTITEDHLPVTPEHQHSAIWIIAQKNR